MPAFLFNPWAGGLEADYVMWILNRHELYQNVKKTVVAYYLTYKWTRLNTTNSQQKLGLIMASYKGLQLAQHVMFAPPLGIKYQTSVTESYWTNHCSIKAGVCYFSGVKL